jgi:hypothetical protein
MFISYDNQAHGVSGLLSRYSYSLGLRAGRPRFDFRQEDDFSLLHRDQSDSGAHPAPYTMGTGGSFPGDEARHEAVHSPPTSTDAKNGGAIPPLHGVVLN